MPRFHIISCSDCDYTQEIPPLPYYGYRSVDFDFVTMPTQFVWCQHCQSVSLAEYLLPLERVEERIASEANRRMRRDAERYRQLLLQRQSPARCLHCGGIDLTLRTQDADRVLHHPFCGGVLLFELGIHAVMRPMTHYYTFEGEYLETAETIDVPSVKDYCPPTGSKLAEDTTK